MMDDKVSFAPCTSVQASVSTSSFVLRPTVSEALKGSWNFRRLLGVLINRESTINWCQEVGLLPKKRKCPKNGKEWMSLVRCSRAYCGSTAVGWRFRCKKHNVDRTISENTWFERHNIPMEDVILLTYSFATKSSYENARKELRENHQQSISDETIADIYSFCREVCMFGLDSLFKSRGPLGGVDKIVEIDEMKFGKRKFQKGRLVEGSWIFGAIQTDTGELRLEICPENRRTSEALLPLIKKHIVPGTTVYSDCSRAYDCLKDHDYKHFNVNHEEYFVDPKTRTNTQMIESQWRPLRLRLQRGGIPKNDLDYHLCEYLWRKEIIKKDLDPFSSLITAIIQVYPGIGQ